MQAGRRATRPLINTTAHYQPNSGGTTTPHQSTAGMRHWHTHRRTLPLEPLIPSSHATPVVTKATGEEIQIRPQHKRPTLSGARTLAGQALAHTARPLASDGSVAHVPVDLPPVRLQPVQHRKLPCVSVSCMTLSGPWQLHVMCGYKWCIGRQAASLR